MGHHSIAFLFKSLKIVSLIRMNSSSVIVMTEERCVSLRKVTYSVHLLCGVLRVILSSSRSCGVPGVHPSWVFCSPTCRHDVFLFPSSMWFPCPFRRFFVLHPCLGPDETHQPLRWVAVKSRFGRVVAVLENQCGFRDRWKN